MGLCHSVALASIFMSSMLKQFFTEKPGWKRHLPYFGRFLDDVFGFWRGTWEDQFYKVSRTFSFPFSRLPAAVAAVCLACRSAGCRFVLLCGLLPPAAFPSPPLLSAPCVPRVFLWTAFGSTRSFSHSSES